MRSRRVLVLCLAAAAAAGPLALPVAAGPGAAPVADPVSLVNPFVGTGVGGAVVGDIDTFPGADVPYGMVQWSPDTQPDRSYGGGYHFGSPQTLGFSLTHLSGPGCPGVGDVPILPAVGPLGTAPGTRLDRLVHSDEQASPGYYRVRLEPGPVRAELTVTQRTGLARLTFPRTTQADVIVKAGGSEWPDASATIRIVGDREIVGSATSAGFCFMPDHYTVYFAIRFDRPFTASGTYGQSGVTPPTSAPAASGPGSGGYVQFDTRRNPVVRMKVGLSYVSVAGALGNLAREDRGFDFDAVHRAARSAWERLLGRIRIRGGTHDQQVTFYTALYHVFLHPNVFSDADGGYTGFDGGVHRLAAGVQYANFSGWDTYRCTLQLQALLDPVRVSDMISSLLRDAAQGGGLPKWEFDNSEASVMNGDSADPLITDAWAFGARRFDAQGALADMVRGASRPVLTQGVSLERPELPQYEHLGYVPTLVPNPTALGVWNATSEWWGSSETMEYAVDDFAVARLAAVLHDRADARTFAARAQNWQYVFDPGERSAAARGADGAFAPGGPFLTVVPAYGQAGFEEGNGAQYTWMVPQNVAGLVAAMGGRTAAAAGLDRLFRRLNAGPSVPYYWAGNEPSLGTPYAYDWIGEPWRTQQIVRAIETQLYSDRPGGEPGNDDLGALSASYVWNALGLYPAVPGTDVLALGSPLFPWVRIVLAGGRTMTVDAPRAATSRPYIRSAYLGSSPWDRAWLPLSLLKNRGVLRVDLGDRPDRAWGSAPAAAPPSYGTGEYPALGYTLPTGRVSLAPTATGTVIVGVQGVAGWPHRVDWSVTAAGVVVSPAGGQLLLPPGSADRTPRATAVLRIRGVAPGIYPLRFTFRAADGTTLPPVIVDAVVA